MLLQSTQNNLSPSKRKALPTEEQTKPSAPSEPRNQDEFQESSEGSNQARGTLESFGLGLLPGVGFLGNQSLAAEADSRDSGGISFLATLGAASNPVGWTMLAGGALYGDGIAMGIGATMVAISGIAGGMAAELLR